MQNKKGIKANIVKYTFQSVNIRKDKNKETD